MALPRDAMGLSAVCDCGISFSYSLIFFINIARSEQSSHTPCGSHQRLKHFQRKDKIVKDFIILNQVVSEKTLMKNVHMCHIRMTEGKIEKLKN